MFPCYICFIGHFLITVEDEQIIWTDKSSQTNKSSDVQTGRANFSTNKQRDICPSGQTICHSRRTSRQQYDKFTHEMGPATERGFMGSFNMAEIKKKSLTGVYCRNCSEFFGSKMQITTQYCPT